jgi:hypothetical protein
MQKQKEKWRGKMEETKNKGKIKNEGDKGRKTEGIRDEENSKENEL